VLWGKQGWFDATVSGMEKGALLVDFDDGSEGTVAANQIATRFRLAGTADSEDVQVTATKGAKKAKAKKKEEDEDQDEDECEVFCRVVVTFAGGVGVGGDIVIGGGF
jgi:hypothetical protein